MKTFLKVLSLIFLLSFTNGSFREAQKQFSRVREAYSEKEGSFKELLISNGIRIEKLRIYIRGFKYNKELELWAKNVDDEKLRLIRTYKICTTSGRLGPKRKQGDGQIPEGFYFIDRFNPNSNFYLSLGLNYPNRSDRILGEKDNLGGDIFIHGACVTIGCIPITDNFIKELYIFCVEAKNSGQRKIPVTIYPAKLSDKNYGLLVKKFEKSIDKTNLWSDLKQAYDQFDRTKKNPEITFLENGRHKIN